MKLQTVPVKGLAIVVLRRLRELLRSCRELIHRPISAILHGKLRCQRLPFAAKAKYLIYFLERKLGDLTTAKLATQDQSFGLQVLQRFADCWLRNSDGLGDRRLDDRSAGLPFAA